MHVSIHSPLLGIYFVSLKERTMETLLIEVDMMLLQVLLQDLACCPGRVWGYPCAPGAGVGLWREVDFRCGCHVNKP